jgi:toxin-antitoxin system PIN domain toxin
MLSIDTNILLPAIEERNPNHEAAATYLVAINERDDVVLSEFVLLELYVLLRNPAVLKRPLRAKTALQVVQQFRGHPRWQIVGFPPDSLRFHNEFWPVLGKESFARRRAFDWRLALSLRRQGVVEFATVNTRDFNGFGFSRVWNPLAG